VLDPGEIDCFMPESGGPSIDDCARVLDAVAALGPVLGIGFTGLVASDANAARLRRIAAAALPEAGIGR
jgi:hypothetical protein